MKLVRMRGDVSIYKNEEGRIHHKLGYTGNIIIPQVESRRKKEEKKIAEVNSYIIKYDRKGHDGYIIYKGKTQIKKDIWYMDAAIKECNRLERQKTPVK